MEKSKTSVVSVMLSCTKNVLLTIVGFYLLYLMFCFITDNSDAIEDSIFAFFTLLAPFFIPIKDFMVNNIGTIFISWMIIALWTCCVIAKIEMSEMSDMKTPAFLNILGFLLVPIGSIVSFMTMVCSDNLALTMFAGVLGFLLLIFFIGLSGSILSTGPAVAHEQDPKQLDLFDEK